MSEVEELKKEVAKFKRFFEINKKMVSYLADELIRHGVQADLNALTERAIAELDSRLTCIEEETGNGSTA